MSNDPAACAEPAGELLRLDRQLCFPLYAASHLVTRRYRPLLAKLGLTYPQYLVMLVLWEHPIQSVGDLGDQLHLDSGTLTPLLKRMERAALIRRERDPADERRVLVTLTAAGHRLRESAAEVPASLARQLNLADGDAERLRKATHAFIAALCGKEPDTSTEKQGG